MSSRRIIGGSLLGLAVGLGFALAGSPTPSPSPPNDDVSVESTLAVEPEGPNGVAPSSGTFAVLIDEDGNLYERGCHAYAAETIRPVWVSAEALLGGFNTCTRIPPAEPLPEALRGVELKPLEPAPRPRETGGAPTPPPEAASGPGAGASAGGQGAVAPPVIAGG